MHEMPVTQGMLDLALKYADGRRITAIYLQVGQMAAVVPDSVELFFEYLSKDTAAEGARLHFETIPMEMACRDCGRQADLSAWPDERPQIIMGKALAQGCVCGSKNLRVTNGVSFSMVSIEVEGEPEGAQE